MRLLIVSDSPAIQSGQARVVREIASRFVVDGTEVTVAGWFHLNAKDPGKFPFQVVPAFKDRPEMLESTLRDVGSDTVLAIGDPWDFRWLARWKAERGGFRLVGYLNVEAGPLPPGLEVVLDAFDVLATTSEFGAEVVGRRGVKAIHHGVDRQVFFPTPKPKELFGRDIHKTFVVLLNGQNIQRKNLATAIAGFALFAEDKRDVLCYANTVPKPGPDDAPGQNLVDVVIQHGVESLVSFNPANRGPLDTVPDEAMNAIYGIADALLMPSVSEGFGLAILEAMTTHTVPIGTAWSSLPELLADGRGELIPASAFFRGAQGTDLAIVSVDGVAEALGRVYEAWQRGDMAPYHQAGTSFSISRPWNRTYEQFREAMARPAQTRAATGLAIDSYLRLKARKAAEQHPGAIGVLKLGGLGDMLQTTIVIRAAVQKYGRPVVAFCNDHAEVFEAMEEVEDVVLVPERLQDEIVRSIADEFEVFLDVRYISRAYGVPVAEFADRHRWFYEAWAWSCSRLEPLERHATSLMLESLGLAAHGQSLAPQFKPRDPDPDLELGYVAVASGGGSLGRLKEWPTERWAEFSGRMRANGTDLVQVGGLEDPTVPLAIDRRGASLARTASILERADALVAIEGGMVHLATAVGCCGVVLFGPTPKALFAYERNGNLGTPACPPCWWGPAWGSQECTIGKSACVNFPSVDEVMDAVAELVNSSEGSVR